MFFYSNITIEKGGTNIENVMGKFESFVEVEGNEMKI